MEVEKEEVRIRRVFGLLRGEKIPEVGLESFKTYQRYLETHLRVPFMAEFERELGPGKFVRIKIRLPSLEDIDELEDDLYGLICMEGWGERSSGFPYQNSMFRTTKARISSWWRIPAYGLPTIGKG